MIHDRRFAFIFRLFAFIFTLSGVLDALGAFQGGIKPERFLFYTILSNALGVILFLVLAIKTGREWKGKGAFGSSGYYPSFELVCVVDLLLTLLVYWIVLVPVNFTMYDGFTPWRLNNIVVHLITPLLCLIDYILFVDSRSLKYKYTYGVVIFPLAYVLIVPRLTSANLYYFLDYSKFGSKVFLIIFGVAIFLLILAHIFYFLNQKVQKPVIPRDHKEYKNVV